jgi:hypothetical protein
LQEISDLNGDGWTESDVPFEQTEGPNGEIITTARINITVTPVNDPPTKFYRVMER